MRSLTKILLAFIGVASIAGAAQANTAGNITFNQTAAACGPLNAVASVIRPAFLTIFSGGGHNYQNVTTYLKDTQGGSNTNYFFLFIFDSTAHRYIVTAPGFPNLAGQITGTYTGTISSSNFYSFTINVTLDCGSTLVGSTNYIGN